MTGDVKKKYLDEKGLKQSFAIDHYKFWPYCGAKIIEYKKEVL